MLPFGAPGDVPPCIRQRPFGIAGDWHSVPAPCPGSTSRAQVHGQFALHGVDPPISVDPLPRGLDHANDSLTARMHVDVLDRDLLLALAAMSVERIELASRRCGRACWLGSSSRVGPRTSVLDHGAPIAFHGGVVGCD